MTTPSVQAPNQQAAPSAAKELFSETALAAQEHQYEEVEIAPITLMSPEQVKALNNDQLVLALTPVKMQRKAPVQPPVNQAQTTQDTGPNVQVHQAGRVRTTRPHLPANGSLAPMEATPVTHVPPAVTMQGTSPLAGLVLPMGYKLVPEDPADAKRAASSEGRSISSTTLNLCGWKMTMIQFVEATQKAV
jgi:hypothetical protein